MGILCCQNSHGSIRFGQQTISFAGICLRRTRPAASRSSFPGALPLPRRRTRHRRGGAGQRDSRLLCGRLHVLGDDLHRLRELLGRMELRELRTGEEGRGLPGRCVVRIARLVRLGMACGVSKFGAHSREMRICRWNPFLAPHIDQDPLLRDPAAPVTILAPDPLARSSTRPSAR